MYRECARKQEIRGKWLTTRADPTSMSSRGSRRRRYPLVRLRGRRAHRHRPPPASRALAPLLPTSERCLAWPPPSRLHPHRRELPVSGHRRVPRARRLLYPGVRSCHPWLRRRREHRRALLLLRRRLQACRFPGMRTTRRLTFSKRRAIDQQHIAAPPPLPAGAFRTECDPAGTTQSFSGGRSSAAERSAGHDAAAAPTFVASCNACSIFWLSRSGSGRAAATPNDSTWAWVWFPQWSDAVAVIHQSTRRS